MSPPVHTKLVVGIDIGGTFTDLIAFDESGRTVYAHKELTTPQDPNKAVAAGIAKLFTANGLQTSAVARVVHATTLFANALIERTGARVGLITTEGFRDTVEIARERKYELYDLFIDIPRPLCPRDRRFEVAERVQADGTVFGAVTEKDLTEIAGRAVAMGCESLAICFVNAFINPVNEVAAQTILKRNFPKVPISASHQIANEIREFDRFSTTIANAYVQPLAERYLTDFGSCLRRGGIQAPVYVMLSNGGLTTVERAVHRPIHLLESGPAAGALAAAYFAQLAGTGDVMALDIGGTTAKLCTIENAIPLITHKFEAAREKRFVADSGLPIRIPTIDLIEIGAGGGSIARKDQLGLLKVGPQSAAADPGPVCYGRGGVEPTVSDSNLLLGFLSQDYFAGGEIRLDVQSAIEAVSRLASDLSLPVLDGAVGVHDLANENMASAARVHAAERGRDPSKLTLVVTGGGGPIHGAGIARKLGIRKMICPPAAGVASAIGLVLAPARIDKVGFVSERLGTGSAAELERRYSELEGEARRELSEMLLPAEGAKIQRFADMRYVGQGFEIFVPLPGGPYDDGTIRTISKAFDNEYLKIFRKTVEEANVEIVNVRVTVTVELTDRRLPILLPRTCIVDPQQTQSSRQVRFIGGQSEPQLTRVFRWDELRDPGQVFAGPALFEQEGSTVVLPPGSRLQLSRSGIATISLDGSVNVGYGADQFDNIGLEILWKRLIGIVDAASASLVRSSFSTVVRESDDYSIIIADQYGRLVVQGTKSIPVFIGSLPKTVKHFLEHFGASGLEDGDILITNDPWMGTGHLSDINLALPIFHRGTLIAFAASTAHAADIGGRSGAQKISDVFQEGFQIPIMKLAERGELDRSVLTLLRKNVRAPDQVLGDLFGQISALQLVRQRLLTVLEEWNLRSLDKFVSDAFGRTTRAMRNAIMKMPTGVYRAEQNTDGMDAPVTIRAEVTVTPAEIIVDYSGSSEQIPAALNVSYSYTHAFTVYALKCLLDRESPNNEGSFEALRVIAPEGSILNHCYPLSGANRALVGHYLPSLVLNALSKAVPEKVIAGVGSPIWSFLLHGRDIKRGNIVLKCFFNGGMGASASRDGLSATSWPSNISSAPVEVIEQLAPVRVNFKRLRCGSGGAGRHRGGLGLEAEFEILSDGPFTIGFNAERTRFPANGLFGGSPGATGELEINGKSIDIRETHQVRKGDRIVVRTPGGGGFGASDERTNEFLVRDTEHQYV